MALNTILTNNTNTTTTGSTFTLNAGWYTNTPTIVNGGWSFTQTLGPGEWVCRQCGCRFYIVDDQPAEIEKRTDRVDVTMFGSTGPQYLTNEHTDLYCSSCRP